MSAEINRSSFTTMHPMFVHPSYGPESLDLKIKSISSSNYRSWKKAMEIALFTKKKLPFVHGTLARPVDDQIR